MLSLHLGGLGWLICHNNEQEVFYEELTFKIDFSAVCNISSLVLVFRSLRESQPWQQAPWVPGDGRMWPGPSRKEGPGVLIAAVSWLWLQVSLLIFVPGMPLPHDWARCWEIGLIFRFPSALHVVNSETQFSWRVDGTLRSDLISYVTHEAGSPENGFLKVTRQVRKGQNPWVSLPLG